MAKPAPDAAQEIGTLIGGRFRIEEPLGMGGMAHVFRARDMATDQEFALKLLKPEIAKDAQAVARLSREGAVLSKLAHPAIVGVETFGELDDGRIFIAMELLKGETLGERVRRKGRLSAEELTPIVTGAAAGLAAAHRAEIVHRDLKPDNIFLVGDPVQVKLLDFGISKVFGIDKLTRTGQILGTPRYMAPEQLSADDDVDGRIDIYALGVILYEALSGRPPFLGSSPSDLIVAILKGRTESLAALCAPPPGVEEVVMRAMARDRDVRYETAIALAEAWVTVASPAGKKAPIQAGAATSFFGGFDQHPDTPGGGSADATGRGLALGTFPEMAQHTPPTGEVVEAVQAAPAAAGPAQGLPAPRTARADEPTKPHRPRAIYEAADAPVPVALPGARGRQHLLSALALIAGAITAAVIVWFLRDAGDAAPDQEHSSEAQPAQEVASPSEVALPTKASPTTNAILAAAEASLTAGQPAECVEQLSALGPRRPAAALRLEADCQRSAGNLVAAANAYERYCRDFPGGPAIDEVRARVAALGGECP